MDLSRRQFVGTGLVAAAAFFGLPSIASAQELDEAINAFTGGAELGSDGVTLIAPEIAENGNTVPIEVDAPGAEAIMILAAGNPSPDVCTFNFGPLAGSRAASTRIRLAGEQEVIAVARMSDGTFKQARQHVRVTIGGCGG
ncbi:thiosulfate oxidation carrier protein SoxY [Roseibacterium sp. SDUM158017]|uniref:thiosulfate oxidation carrier protein SoxY n=1 Tax=Roseicyclus salinarum TaxID=3036773 RepID=UPI002414E113|nr:thiosulfate oxidation carrier protein SoxY [Roseibacterium sp. SDUM158017]MDG4649382.1 thiosulfate oxidation carrier protein SoxY [Roseibacterium sp. SDUM158017]